MSKERDGVSPTPNAPAEGPSAEDRRDRIKGLIFFFGAIGFILALKFILGY